MPRGLRRLGCGFLIGMISASALLSACTSSPRWISLILEAAPPAKPIVRHARHPPYTATQPPPRVALREEVAPTDWAAMRDLLPKDANGGTDWVLALNEKLIEPRWGLDPKAEDQPVLDLDIELVPKDLPDFKATFPHQIHTQMLACTNCHTGIFQMEKGADPITMEKIFAGEYCGRCHGKVAFDTLTGCPRCHLSMPH